jgi:hypothetical protein
VSGLSVSGLHASDSGAQRTGEPVACLNPPEPRGHNLQAYVMSGPKHGATDDKFGPQQRFRISANIR